MIKVSQEERQGPGKRITHSVRLTTSLVAYSPSYMYVYNYSNPYTSHLLLFNWPILRLPPDRFHICLLLHRHLLTFL